MACTVAGIGGGLLVLTRENALAWLPLLGLWMWVWRGNAEGGMRNAELSIHDSASTIRRSAFRLRAGPGRRGYALGAYVLGVGFILVPVGVRNSMVGGAWSVSTFQAGPNFYIGNNREADGRYRPLVLGHELPDFEPADATKPAGHAPGRWLGPPGASAPGTRRRPELRRPGWRRKQRWRQTRSSSAAGRRDRQRWPNAL